MVKKSYDGAKILVAQLRDGFYSLWYLMSSQTTNRRSRMNDTLNEETTRYLREVMRTIAATKAFNRANAALGKQSGLNTAGAIDFYLKSNCGETAAAVWRSYKMIEDMVD